MGSWRESKRALHDSHADVGGAEELGETLAPRPFGTRAAAVEIERGDAVLGIGVTREVRLGEHHESGDAARAGEDVPRAVVQRMELELVDDAREEVLQAADVAQRVFRTSGRFDEPLSTDVHVELA